MNAALAIACSILCTLQAAAAEDLRERLEALPDAHPRLFLTPEDEAPLRERIAADPRLVAVEQFIFSAADLLLDVPPLERKQEGKRLLGVSRECLRRVSYLAYTYRMKKDERHLRRAEAEMLAAARFSDWNPSHFLDVAEMTAALAVGYDWLYNDLEAAARDEIRQAILAKGLESSLPGGWWVTTGNNWNQVCHGGLTMGALATMPHNPDLAHQIIERGLKNLPRALHEYEPDGIYPEGASYWDYGTTYNLLFVDALESALGTDFGIADHAAFLKSPEFMLHVTGNSGRYFNFADGGEGGSVAPAMFWFARRLDRPELLYHELKDLAAFAADPPEPTGGSRVLVFLLLWAGGIENAPLPKPQHWHGDGPSPVAMHRSGWGERDTFAAIKAGSPSTNHGHMDIGSFVLEMRGVRWAVDLGAQGYHSLESRGIGLWNKAQDGGRWTVFRLNNLSHNTLVVNGEHQRVKGVSPILKHEAAPENAFTILDMRPVYEGQLAHAHRGLRMLGDAVLIQDELAADGEPAAVRWGMTTRADVTVTGPATAQLQQGGETVSLQVVAPAEVQLRYESIETPPAEHDAENPGHGMILFDLPLAPGQRETIAVTFTPGDTPQSHDAKPLKSW